MFSVQPSALVSTTTTHIPWRPGKAFAHISRPRRLGVMVEFIYSEEEIRMRRRPVVMNMSGINSHDMTVAPCDALQRAL